MDRDGAEKRISELERQLAEARGGGAYPLPPLSGSLNALQVRNVAFSAPPRGQRGYNQAEVDAFLHRVEAALRIPAEDTLSAEQVRSVTFSKASIGQRGYNKDEVDAFVDLVEQQMAPRPATQLRGNPLRSTARPSGAAED